METINRPDEADDNNDLSVVADQGVADEQPREAASLAAQRAARPTDEDGNTVLGQDEVDAADEG